MSNEKSTSLIQTRPWKQNNQLTLQDGRTLRIKQSGGSSNKTYFIDIIALNENYKRKFIIYWPWLLLSVVLVGAAYTESQYQLMLPGVDLIFSSLLSMLLSMLGLACIIGSIKFSYSKFVFSSRHTHVPLVEPRSVIM